MKYTIKFRKNDDTTESVPEDYPTLARAFRAARNEVASHTDKYVLATIWEDGKKVAAVDRDGFFYNLRKP